MRQKSIATAESAFDRHDSASVIGDPLVNAMLGWNSGSLFWNASMLVNVPIGNYRENHIAQRCIARGPNKF